MNEPVDLFGGTPGALGGLSNERELLKQIPAEFRNHHNPWTSYANSVFFNGANTAEWEWRSSVPLEIRHQRQCFHAALSGFDLQHEDKEALCGWMLSEMLTGVPA